MSSLPVHERHDTRVLLLKAVLLSIWAVLSFGACYFARDLEFMVGPWPFGYWIASQGALIGFIAIVAIYAWAMDRLDPDAALPPADTDDA
jgi:putative solute:sodium symporter small subunit